MTMLRRSAFLALAAPLALGLAACSSEGDDPAAIVSAKAIPAIPAPAGQEWSQVASATPEGGFVMGNPDAPLKLIEYASHTCSHCSEFSELGSARLRDQYVNSGVVSYELRNQIHDPIDLTFALLARCAGPESFHPLAEQGWAHFDQIVGAAQANGPALQAATELPEGQRYMAIAEASGLLEFFAARGISVDQASQCLADPAKATAIVEASEKQSEELKVDGTPTFLLNGVNLGSLTWTAFEPKLQEAGAR